MCLYHHYHPEVTDSCMNEIHLGLDMIRIYYVTLSPV